MKFSEILFSYLKSCLTEVTATNLLILKKFHWNHRMRKLEVEGIFFQITV